MASCAHRVRPAQTCTFHNDDVEYEGDDLEFDDKNEGKPLEPWPQEAQEPDKTERRAIERARALRKIREGMMRSSSLPRTLRRVLSQDQASHPRRHRSSRCEHVRPALKHGRHQAHRRRRRRRQREGAHIPSRRALRQQPLRRDSALPFTADGIRLLCAFNS